MFGNFFRKKEKKESQKDENTSLNPGDVIIPIGENLTYKAIRQLSPELIQKVEDSTLGLMAAQLYMHYWQEDLVCNDPNDPAWQNQAIFFWKAEEPFPKKSLPPDFETYQKRFFVFVKTDNNIALKTGTAMPWFGMPGMGEKHFCERLGQKITVPELSEMGIVEYIEPVELTNDNTSILTDRDNYFYLIDERLVRFRNNGFYAGDKLIPIHIAYSIGGIHIVKKKK